MAELPGKIDTLMEPGVDHLPPLLAVPAVPDAEVQMILELIGESHEKDGAVVGGQGGHPTAQSPDGGFVPGQGRVACDEAFDQFTDGSPDLSSLRVRDAASIITEVAMSVGRMQKAGCDYGPWSP